ncbi:Uncharacterised protein [Vibrio cholerae]|nr:Uncharacterised protein [Vibrio cholerae]
MNWIRRDIRAHPKARILPLNLKITGNDKSQNNDYR